MTPHATDPTHQRIGVDGSMAKVIAQLTVWSWLSLSRPGLVCWLCNDADGRRCELVYEAEVDAATPGQSAPHPEQLSVVSVYASATPSSITSISIDWGIGGLRVRVPVPQSEARHSIEKPLLRAATSLQTAEVAGIARSQRKMIPD